MTPHDETNSTGTFSQEIPNPRRYYAFWGLSLGLAFALAFLSYAMGLSYKGSAFLGVTMLAICLWGFNLLHEGLVAVMLPMGYILLGVGTPKQVLAPWTQPMGWLVLGGLMTGLVLMHTGLARRIALWSLHITGGSFIRLLWGLLLAGFIIAPLMPTALGKGILISIICIGICDALGFAPRTREASIILIAGYIATSAPRLGLYTGGGEVTLAMQLLASAGIDISWMDYFFQCYLPNVIYSVCSLAVLILIMRPDNKISARAYLEEQFQKLGPMSLKEKKATAVFVLLVVLMMTDKYHGIDIGWIMMLIGFLCFLPGLHLVDSKRFATLNMTSVLFVVGCGRRQAVCRKPRAPVAGHGRAHHHDHGLSCRHRGQFPPHACGGRQYLHRPPGRADAAHRHEPIRSRLLLPVWP